MDVIMNFLINMKETITIMFGRIPMTVMHGLFAVVIAFGVGNAVYMLADSLSYYVFRIHIASTRKKAKNRELSGDSDSDKNNLVVAGGAVAHRYVFKPTCSKADLTGMSQWNWSLLQMAVIGVAVVLSMNTQGDMLFSMVRSAALAYGVTWGFQKFMEYLAEVRTKKDAIDMLYMIQEQLVIQRNSLTRAMIAMRENYITHVMEYGDKSWYHKNYVLARMVYLVSTQVNFVPQQILQQIGEELGSIDVIRQVINNTMSRVEQTGDAGSVIKEEIESFTETYQASIQETIPQLSDKLFLPIMLTHFMPFLVILLWPVVEAIYQMMGSGGMSTPSFFGN